jgi:RNA polymerase sigma-70 factor (ECF subfamily)
MDSSTALTDTAPALGSIDVATIHREHANFVWRSLQRLGIRPSELEDVFQEVFIVVQRRLHTFDGSSKVSTWLFGVCFRIASAQRRRNWYRRLVSIDRRDEELGSPASELPDALLAHREARAVLDRALDKMDLTKRAVFVMYELDELSTDEIADILGVPLGTVHSRLHAARKQFEAILVRMKIREGFSP